MSEPETNGLTNGTHHFDRNQLEKQLLSSSSKARLTTVNLLHHHITHKELDTPQKKAILDLLFETYPLYVERSAREAVQECIKAVCASEDAADTLPGFLRSIDEEVKKGSLAPANNFVLVEWLWVLLEQISANPQLWEKWGKSLITADARAIEACMGSTGKQSLKQSALVVTRRAWRKV